MSFRLKWCIYQHLNYQVKSYPSVFFLFVVTLLSEINIFLMANRVDLLTGVFPSTLSWHCFCVPNWVCERSVYLSIYFSIFELKVSHRYWDHGGSPQHLIGGLSQYMGGSMGWLKKVICEEVHFLVKMQAIRMQASNFSKNELHTYLC